MKIPAYQIEAYVNNIARNDTICGALLYGPESGLVMLRSQKIARQIVADPKDQFLISGFSEKKLENDHALLADEFFSIPMLGGRKLITINEAANHTASALKLIFTENYKAVNLKESNFILIIAGNLESSSALRKFAEASPYIASLPCYEDEQATILQLIRQKFTEGGVKIERGLPEFIIDRFGKNRLLILNEIEKLLLFRGNNKEELTIEIVERVISDVKQTSGNDFINYFAEMDFKNSLNSLDKLFAEKVSVITLIRFLVNYFFKLWLVKSNLAEGANLESEIKSQKLFFKQEALFRKHLNKWKLSELNLLLSRLQALEIACKNSSSNPELLLFAFVSSALPS